MHRGPRTDNIKAQGARYLPKQGAGRRTRTQDCQRAGRRAQGTPAQGPRAPDPPQIKVYHAPWPSLPRRNSPRHEPNMPYSKRLDEARVLLRWSSLPSIPSRRVNRPIPNGHQAPRHRACFQSLSRSSSSEGLSSMSSKNSPPAPCSSGVISFAVPSITKACGYCFCNAAKRAVISSRDI